MPMRSVESCRSDRIDPQQAAQAAGLRYTADTVPGFTRRRWGKAFRFFDAAGRVVRTEKVRARLQALVIPPAWREVWISPDPRGHLQATGRDERGRKQYIYHPQWRAIRDETKYTRLAMFGKTLPRLRRRVTADLRLPGIPRDKVLATIVQLLERTFMRVGNDEYARQNGSFGLTTLRNHHAKIQGDTIRFQFRGKSGKEHAIEVRDRRLSQLVRRCRDLPGQDLFTFLDEQGRARDIGSADVNDYLRRVTGYDFTAKDFRTWAGTLLAARSLRNECCGSNRHNTQAINRAVDIVASHLGNTRAVCQKCYIHPAIFQAFLQGTLARAFSPGDRPVRPQSRGEELALLSFLATVAG